MDSLRFHSSSSILFLLLLGILFPSSMVYASLGINYGQIADNLPSPTESVHLVQSIGAKKVKLFDANPQILRAFANTDIELIVGLGNDNLLEMRYPEKALTWVKTNVQPYLPATKVTGIVVGNEVLVNNDASMWNNLVPSMQSIYQALSGLGLEKQIFVTTAHSFNIMETSHPPSAGAFKQNLMAYMVEIAKFHAQTGSPFFINTYPYFAYKSNPNDIQLNFVLSEPNQGFVDPATSLHYDNMLFAQLDAVYSALSLLGYGGSVSISVSETGWPSKGDVDEIGATSENAAKYNGNLMKAVAQRKVTPMRPSSDLDTYIFALFNENMKPGPTSERNFGLFKPDKTPVYPLTIVTTGLVITSNSNFGRLHHHVGLMLLFFISVGSFISMS